MPNYARIVAVLPAFILKMWTGTGVLNNSVSPLAVKRCLVIQRIKLLVKGETQCVGATFF